MIDILRRSLLPTICLVSSLAALCHGQTLRYFDGVNFAPKIHCPLLMDVGLIDTAVPSEGAIAAFNRLAGPKLLIVGPRADHTGTNNSKDGYWHANASWFNALQGGKLLPMQIAPPNTSK